jgi:hypothetical protein
MKIKPRHFSIALACLAAILVGYAILRGFLGPFLPKIIDENLPNAVIVAALGIFLYNRKLRADEAKAAADEAKAAAAAKERGDDGSRGEGA